MAKPLVDARPLDPGNLRFILGLKLRKLRQERGLSLSELAARAGISVSYLSEIESGHKHPKPEKLIRLAGALAVSYDELVSLQVAEELDPLKAFLGSDFVREFPFELFGIEPEDLFALVADVPSKSAALFQTFLEIGRTYGVQVEHLLFAALRSYQQLRHNYFLEMEKAAAAFREAQGWAKGETPSADTLRALLEGRYGCVVDDASLARHPHLHGFRSVYLPGDPPRLLVNDRLLSSQKAFIYGREIAYRELGLRERAVTGSWLNVESFPQVLNNFKASYFAGAVLIDEEALVDELSALFGRDRWDGEAFLDCMRRFDATPEMFFYRLSQIVPERFGLEEIFFMRFHHATGSDDYRLSKVLNLSHVPVPHGIGLDEHYCRRWPALRLLRDLDRGQWPGLAPAPGRMVTSVAPVAAQRSRFLDEDATFFVIAVVRQLALTEGVKSGVSFGFLLNDVFRERVRFWNDPQVPDVVVNLTCERCGLTPEECQERVAPPTLYLQEQEHDAQKRALAALLEDAGRPAAPKPVAPKPVAPKPAAPSPPRRSRVPSGARHHVYVVLLDSRVMAHRAFVDQNPNLAPDTVCLYVGMTGLTPEARFASHKEGHKANRYVQRYGIRLLPEMYEKLNPLTYEEAQAAEARLADELRSAGYAVWQR